MVTQEDMLDFMVRLGGAMAGGLEDAAFEAYWKANLSPDRSMFPYNSLDPKLPSNDDLIVGGLSIPPWVIGALMEENARKKGDYQAQKTGERLKEFGEGNVIYAGNMIIQRLSMLLPDSSWWTTPFARAGARPTGGAPKPDIGHKVIRL